MADSIRLDRIRIFLAVLYPFSGSAPTGSGFYDSASNGAVSVSLSVAGLLRACRSFAYQGQVLFLLSGYYSKEPSSPAF